jgi:hypothetical protein
MIELEASKHKGDTVTWKWLKKLLEHLQGEGMSSDDTEIEGYQVVYRVKTRPWRHPDISLCMESIDEQRIGVLSFSRQGSKPAKRIRGGTLISTRPHVDGLPEAFYDPQWMKQPANGICLQVSTKPFQWMRWKGQTALGGSR